MEFTTETSISSQQLPPLTILDAINFAAGAWNRVKQRVIQSSWRRSGILPPMVQSPYSMANETEENLESEVINLVEQLPLEESMTTVREYIDLEEGTYNGIILFIRSKVVFFLFNLLLVINTKTAHFNT